MSKVGAGAAVDPRAAARSNVFLAATLVTAAGPRPARLRNISSNGVLLEGVDLPAQGANVHLLRGSLHADGEVVWLESGHCGLRFNESVIVNDWVRRVGHSGQQEVDRLIAILRSPSRSLPGAPLATPPNEDSLESISAELSEACEHLASLPDILTRHADELLHLDAIAQRLRNLVVADS